MVRALNEYLENVSTEETEGGYLRYNEGVALVKELYDTALDTLVMVTLGDNKEKLMENGVTVEGNFNEVLEEKNQKVLSMTRKILGMRFGYNEVLKNMNKDRIFVDETSMTKEELSYKHYTPQLVDFDENKGIHSSDSMAQAVAKGEVERAVFLPMYHRSATMEFRILEGGVIKMTDLETEDKSNSIVIMPVKDYEIIDVMLINTRFTEYNMSEEEFEGIRDTDAVRMAWLTVLNGDVGQAHLDMAWDSYERENGLREEEEVSDENKLDDLDAIILLSRDEMTNVQSTENEVKLFVKDVEKREDNDEIALKMEDAFQKYKTMFDSMREQRINEKSLKMAKIVNTIKEDKQEQQ